MDYLDQTVAHFAFLEALEKIISYEKSYEIFMIGKFYLFSLKNVWYLFFE